MPPSSARRRKQQYHALRILLSVLLVSFTVWLFVSAQKDAAGIERLTNEWEVRAMDAAAGLARGGGAGTGAEAGESVQHIVLFQFKDGTAGEVVRETSERMLGLAEKCIHPETKKPYIRALIGGKDNSLEGLQNGITHAFIVEFENEADRDYYVSEDPTHLAFVASVGEMVEKAIVVDFAPGVF